MEGRDKPCESNLGVNLSFRLRDNDEKRVGGSGVKSVVSGLCGPLQPLNSLQDNEVRNSIDLNTGLGFNMRK